MVMQLANDSDCLYIPALLGKVIWKDSLGNTVQIQDLKSDVGKTNQDQQFLEKILNCIPKWLTYDKRDVIEQEIHNLISKYPIVSRV